MVMKVGVVGLSPGNGHPFSFSAIVNGFDPARFGSSGWPVIHEYLSRQPRDAFGFDGVRVTHAWTQDAETTARLRDACGIDHACGSVSEMVEAVDALIIARDDWETHADMAMPALEAGKPVFVDKPLTLKRGELRRFLPYLEAGQLMSTSGLRYASELDVLRADGGRLGRIRMVNGVVLNGIEKYGIHLLEAVAGLGLGVPVRVSRLPVPHDAFVFELDSGVPFTLHCLGDVAKTFNLHVFGEKGHLGFDLHDNFTAFRRTLDAFFTMCQARRPPIPPSQTVGLLEALMQTPRSSATKTPTVESLA